MIIRATNAPAGVPSANDTSVRPNLPLARSLPDKDPERPPTDSVPNQRAGGRVMTRTTPRRENSRSPKLCPNGYPAKEAKYSGILSHMNVWARRLNAKPTAAQPRRAEDSMFRAARRPAAQAPSDSDSRTANAVVEKVYALLPTTISSR